MNPKSNPIGPTAGRAAPATEDAAVYRKVNWRLLPLLLVCYMVAFLDRINIGYAQLQMKQTLSFDAPVYALGAGIFFIGYFLFEIPSNLMLEKIGARKTLLRIMFCWGLAAAGMMFVGTPTQFYVLRFLLGALEAGFFPGIILYFTYWYPSARRGQVIAIFMSAATVAGMVAGPISGAILKYFDHVGGYFGWQWLFILQGLPAAILGIVIYLRLDDGPEHADWLSPAEKALLRERLEHDEKDIEGESDGGFLHMLRDPKAYCLALTYFLLLGATYTVVFTLPSLIHGWGIHDLFTVGLLAAVPQVCAIGGMIWFARHSDAHKERRRHYAFATTLAAAGLGVVTLTQGHASAQIAASLAGLTLAYIGLSSATPLFFALTSEYLSKGAAAGGLALISSLGNLGPAVAPSINAMLAKSTGSNVYGLYLLMAMYVASGLVVLAAIRAAGTHPGASAHVAGRT
ncbi:MFS transporter [Burkholderia guangdongensis]|uniref:MFS transporter n=1 Tax=Burkholderia guangdongensis TaxID=1792500 RepID=UPI0015CDE4C1|nr:MFS transporter [Burkholderia guangdongensis]